MSNARLKSVHQWTNKSNKYFSRCYRACRVICVTEKNKVNVAIAMFRSIAYYVRSYVSLVITAAWTLNTAPRTVQESYRKKLPFHLFYCCHYSLLGHNGDRGQPLSQYNEEKTIYIYSIELITRFHCLQNISIVIISQWVCIKIINFEVSKFVSASCSEVIAAGTEWIVLFLYFAQKYGSFERQENIPAVAHHNHAAWHCDREHGKHNGRFVDILCTWREKHLQTVSEKCKYWIPTHDSLFVFWADEILFFHPVEIRSRLRCYRMWAKASPYG